MAWLEVTDLAAVLLATSISLVLSLLGVDVGPLRIILGVALVLLLPGYALVAAIFHGRFLGPLKRLVLSVASSVSVAALGGLVLNQTPGGLQTLSWSIWLGAVILIASAVAMIRRLRHPAGIRPHITLRLRAPDIALLGLTAVLIALALNLSAHASPPAGLQGYSTLWMVPAENQPSNILEVGIQSSEFDNTDYKLQLLMNGKIVKEWPAITLRPGQSWQTDLQLPAGPSGRRLDLNLYRLDAPSTLYRHTSVTTAPSGS